MTYKPNYTQGPILGSKRRIEAWIQIKDYPRFDALCRDRNISRGDFVGRLIVKVLDQPALVGELLDGAAK